MEISLALSGADSADVRMMRLMNTSDNLIFTFVGHVLHPNIIQIELLIILNGVAIEWRKQHGLRVKKEFFG